MLPAGPQRRRQMHWQSVKPQRRLQAKHRQAFCCMLPVLKDARGALQ